MVSISILRARRAFFGLGAFGFSISLGLGSVATTNTIVAGGE